MSDVLPITEAGPGDARLSSDADRRGHRRLDMHLPLEAFTAEPGSAPSVRATTRNISPTGVYFEVPAGALEVGAEVRLSLSVPPGEGYSPFAGRVTGTAEVVRIDQIVSERMEAVREGIAARFLQPLRCAF